MQVVKGISNIPVLQKAIVTQGTFDGVHVGHKKILNHVVSEAQRLDGVSVLITFYPHPRLVIHPDDNSLKLLTTLEEKKALLENIGLDYLIILPFTSDISNLSPLEYVRDVIVNKLNPTKLIVGYDHRFGKNREGSITDLLKFSETFDFQVEQISAKALEEITISSTKIRASLAEGNVQKANKYLGYAYQFTGKVVKGMQIGRTIGYKTANLAMSDPLKRVPGYGIFAAKIYHKNETYLGMLSIGSNPTIPEKTESIEVNIFNFDQEIYEETLTVELVRKIRDEIKFPDLDALKEQLAIDKEKCLHILGD